jgi:hypothetical protein
MARFEITSPDGKRYEVTAPDGASQDEVLAYAQKQFAPKSAEKPLSPTDGMSGSEKFLAGMGKGFVDLGRGAGQVLGLKSQADIDEARKMDAPLMDTGAGMAGQLTGQLAAFLPALAIPGANTVAGAAAMGGLSGALQPTGEGESRLANTLTSAAVGGGAQAALGKLAKVAGSRLAATEARGALQAAQNAPRDATLRAAQEAGYVIPPSQAGAGIVPRVLEGISGKVKTNQAAAVKNQNVTDALARKAIGLAEDAPITREALQTVRQEAYQTGYAPIRALGDIAPDFTFKRQAQLLTSRADNAAKGFGDLVESDAAPLAEGLTKVKSFTGDQAVDQIAIFREKASDLYAQGNKTLGKAYRQAADLVEEQIERQLSGMGKDGAAALKQFKEARTRIAKSWSVENALVEGGGKVNAKVLGAAFQKGKPLTAELETIGRFAINFRDVAGVPQSGFSSPITALDAFGTAGMAGMGAGPLSIALPAARLGARGLIGNQGFQRSMVGPTYGPNAAQRLTPELLEELRKRGAGGLLGAGYSGS